jgi:hypothetical protein
VNVTEVFLGLLLGIGLAAACGFRVFVPLLVVSIAQRAGHLELAQGFQWIGSWPALLCFAVATAVEVLAYYIPWVDNLLDTVAGPLAVVAGTVLTASVVGDLSPVLRWGLAAVAGGGTAAVVQVATTMTRATSSVTTGGLGNPVVSTVEAGASTGLSLLAVLVPVLAGLIALGLVALAVWVTVRLARRRRAGRLHRASGQPAAGPGSPHAP